MSLVGCVARWIALPEFYQAVLRVEWRRVSVFRLAHFVERELKLVRTMPAASLVRDTAENLEL